MHDSIRQAMTNIAQGRPAYAPPAPPEPIYSTPDMAPRELERFIHDHGVVGQDAAVKTAALICYRHFSMNCASVSLFAGPTGSGKTQIWRTLAAEFPYIHIFDSSNLSNEGWRGSNKISYQFRAMHPGIREHCILVFDEFDKLLEPKFSGDMNVSESIQNELLRIFDHDVLYFGPERGDDQPLTINARGVSCVLLGAFDNLIKAKSRAPVSLGFGGTPKGTTLGYDTTEITVDDLMRYTQIRSEIAGRIDRITCLKPLNSMDYYRILLKHVDDLCHKTGSTITIDPVKLQAIAAEAVQRPLGARWAIAQVSKIIDDLVYDDPFETNYVYSCDGERTVTENEGQMDPPY